MSCTSQSRKSVNIVTCAVDQDIKLWPLPDENQLDTKSTSGKIEIPVVSALATLRGHEDRCCRVAFHPSGLFIGSTSFDKTWRLWDVETRKEIYSQPGHSRGVYGIAFQNDGALVATGDIGGVGRVWDLRTGKAILPLEGHAKQLLCIDFSPNGYHVATGSADHTIRIWDLRSRKPLYMIPAHSAMIAGIRYQPTDGYYLVSASYDNTSKVWSGMDFSLIRTLAGHDNKVIRAEIAPNSNTIATVSHDRTWKLWRHEG